jgi:N utilization substance protein A
VREVLVDDESKQATVVVPDDQLSLAIGKEGQNARLAARLTGWRVDIRSETEFAEEEADMAFEEEDAGGRCAAIMSNGRRCPNAALPGSRYCGLPAHQELENQEGDEVAPTPGEPEPVAEEPAGEAAEAEAPAPDAGEGAAEEAPAEERPVEAHAAEEALAEPATEEPPVEAPPAEEAPIEEPPVEAPAAEAPAAEEALAEPAAEEPARETPDSEGSGAEDALDAEGDGVVTDGAGEEAPEGAAAGEESA